LFKQFMPARRFSSVTVFFIATGLLFMTTQAWAAAAGGGKTSGMGGTAEGTFVAAIILLLIVGRGLGEVLQRYGQPAIMGQLIGGILLGPSLFGLVWPSAQHLIFSTDPAQKSMIDAVSQLGILLLLMLTGMETDLKLVRRVGAACFAISATGVLVPFVCGFALAQFLPASLLPKAGEHIVAGLFLGTALSISSVKIVAMVVREMNFMRRNLGQVIVSSAIIEDTIGWLIVAITFGIASSGHIELWPLTKTVVGVAAFMGFSFTIGRRIVFTLIRWANDWFKSEFAVITMILIIMGTMALTTNLLGVHTVLGAFVSGILIGESPILSDHIESQLRGIITALFMPVFFGTAGLSANLTVLADPQLALLTVGLVLIASIGKFSGAFAGGKATGFSWGESLAVGTAMNARGSTEVIVATIGLSMGVLSHNLFTMIVTMAVITTLAMPPMLRWSLRRLPMGAEEKQRVDREALDERGLIPNLERLLLAVDDSAIGKFTANLAGLIGGSRGMPTTLLQLKDGRVAIEKGAAGPEEHLREIKKGAMASASVVKEQEDEQVEKVHLTARTEKETITAKTIQEEAKKGYDLLLIGLDKAADSKGVFAKNISEIADGFDGPLALVLAAHGDGKPIPPLKAGSKILVPVNGTEVSRRAAEIAFALARPHRAHVKALYVLPTQDGKRRAPTMSHRREEGVLKDIVDLADRYGVRVQTAVITHVGPDVAVCREAAKDSTMIVMGVTQRPGDELFFGTTATAVLSSCKGPIMLVASERVRPRSDSAEREGKEDAAEKSKQAA
jgi:Kef-type K+ transport system membrane component KefB/nucleotide-binding universal stress UspA family protein